MSKSKTLIFALAASGLLAQAPTTGPLMIVHPVALDASGQPVTDLTAADFKIVDDNKPQTILYFRRPNTEKSAPLGPLEHANRPAGIMPHTSVILFDLMNQNQADRLETWKSLDKTLPTLESGDSLYFYVLDLEGAMIPIHPLGPKAPADATWPKDAIPTFDKVMKATSHGRPVQLGQEDQVKKTFHDLEVLAAQLASYPGRRDILWVTSGIQNVYNPKLPCNGDWVDCALYVPHLAVALAKSDVAVDPVSYSRDLSTGVNRDFGKMDHAWTPVQTTASAPNAAPDSSGNDARGSSMSSSTAAPNGPDPALDLAQLALLSGGRTYFKMDIRTVIADVGRADASEYEMAYDPSSSNWDNKFHRIHITCERKTVRVEGRERYYAIADARPPMERIKATLMETFQNPNDAADIGIRTKIAPLEGDKKGVHLDVRIDPSDLLLKEQGGKYSGAIYFLISDRSATGPLGEPIVASFNLDFTPDQYKTIMKEGVPLSQDHPTTDAVQDVRVIVLDQNTNQVGSLTFAVK